MMQDLARQADHVATLDSSSLLLERGTQMFLDDCHLTEVGHRLLAQAIAESLQSEGWLPQERGEPSDANP